MKNDKSPGNNGLTKEFYETTFFLKGGESIRYFQLERDIRQGFPASACLFIPVLEIAFPWIKTSSSIEGLNIFNYNFLYTAYTDGTIFL